MPFTVEVSDKKIIEADLFSESPDPACGAEVVFLGRVRDFNFGKQVVAVSYDAFKPLTEKVFHQLCEEAKAKFGERLNATVLHRTGKLFPGEISVAIVVSTPHRDEAYEASRYIIENLKTRSPIWKKEHYENSETQWLRGHALCQHNHAHRNLTGGGKVHAHGPGQVPAPVDGKDPSSTSV